MTYSIDPQTDPAPYGHQNPYAQPSTPGYAYPGHAGAPNGYGYGYGGCPPGPAPKSQKKVWAWVIGLCIMLTLIGGAVLIAPFAILAHQASQMTSEIDDMTGDQTERILSENLGVELGDATVAGNEYSDRVELSVTLTNTGDERATFTVDIEAVSESGERIADGSAYATGLAPGQSVTTDVTFYPKGSTSKYDLEDAEYRVIEVSMY